MSIRTARTAELVRFCFGDLARGLLAGLITSYVMVVFIPQSTSSLPVLLPAAAVTFAIVRGVGSVFDAVVDPLVAWLSDRSRHPRGRRVPFLRWAALPWAATSALIVFTPFDHTSGWNTVWVAVVLPLYYLSSSLYLVPYFALMAEIVTDLRRRVWFYTLNSLFFVLGSAVVFLTPVLKARLLAAGFDELTAWRIAFAVFASLGFIAAVVPAWSIREREVVEYTPAYVSLPASFAATFRYRQFTILTAANLVMQIAFTLFNATLLYYITMLIGQPEWFSTVVLGIAIVLGIASYPLVNVLAARWGKKPLMVGACATYVVLYVAIWQADAVLVVLPGAAFAVLIGVLIAFPISITNVLPPAAFADLTQYDTLKTGIDRAGMFFASRNFVISLSQSVVLIAVPTLIALGGDDGRATVDGVRLTALVAAIAIALALVLFTRYDDREIIQTITASSHSDAPAEATQPVHPSR